MTNVAHLLAAVLIAACGADRDRGAPPPGAPGGAAAGEGEGEDPDGRGPDGGGGDGAPDGGDGPPAEGDGEGDAPGTFCGPYADRPDEPPDDAPPPVEAGPVCTPACSGRTTCVPPGECVSTCQAPMDCPIDVMRTVRRADGTTFRIDAYEASRPDAGELQEGCNRHGRPCSQPGVRPWSDVTWTEADAACEKVGKRLCTLDEWRDACRSACGFTYPYGDEFDGQGCNGFGANSDGADFWETGRKAKCTTPDWVYDLVGNAREWTATEAPDGPGTYLVVGGSPLDQARSILSCSGDDAKAEAPDNAPRYIGFRCCAG